MRLLFTGNFILEPIKRGFANHDVSIAAFNDYRAVLAGVRDSALADRDAVICLIDGVELAAEYEFDSVAIASAILEYAEDCQAFAATHPSLLVIVSTIRLPTFSPASFSDAICPSSNASIEGGLAAKLSAASLSHNNLFILDLARIVGHFGERGSYNTSMRFFARFGFTVKFLEALIRQIELLLAAILQRSNKVLALDFDNTLWGGIVGEVGANGIELSQDGKGRAFRQFQSLVRQLSQRGIILVGLSKNNLGDVDEVFEKNAMMILKRDDFTLLCIAWVEKPYMLENAMDILNLGLSSVVFIDDNPVERQMMKDMLPEVHVPEFPTAAEMLPNWFLETVIPEYFPTYRITEEDLEKVQQYETNAQRSSLRNHLSVSDFITTLDIQLKFFFNTRDIVVRLSQMTQKTNQFNLTTRRYSITEMAQMIASERFDVVGVEYADRFGKEGVTALAILDGDAGEIDSFLMSCRIIGRGVENELMRKIEGLAAERGHKELVAVFRPTAKNVISKDFLRSQGFALLPHSDEQEQRYRKVLDAERTS